MLYHGSICDHGKISINASPHMNPITGSLQWYKNGSETEPESTGSVLWSTGWKGAHRWGFFFCWQDSLIFCTGKKNCNGLDAIQKMIASRIGLQVLWFEIIPAVPNTQQLNFVQRWKIYSDRGRGENRLSDVLSVELLIVKYARKNP